LWKKKKLSLVNHLNDFARGEKEKKSAGWQNLRGGGRGEIAFLILASRKNWRERTFKGEEPVVTALS